MPSKTLKKSGIVFRTFHWEKDFSRQFFQVAIPIAIQNLVTASAHILDGIMIAGLGDAYYAAVSQAGRYSFLFSLLMFGAASGSCIFISQFYGSKNEDGIKKIMSLCLRITVSLALLFLFGALMWPRQIMTLFLRPGLSFDLGMEYLQYVALSYVFAAIEVVFSNTLRAANRPKIAMMSGIAGILVNTFLNYCLIYGHFGFPALAVKGAAIATTAAAFVSMAISMGYTYIKKHIGMLHLSDILQRPSKEFFLTYCKKVIPVVCNEGLWALGTTVYGMFYGTYSDAAVSAVGVYGTLDQLVTVLIFGTVNATAILIGTAIGAHQREEARLIAFRMLLAVEVVCLFTGGLLLAFRFPILNLYASFSSLSEEALRIASHIIVLAAVSMPFRHFNTINVVGVLRSGGDTVFSMLLDGGLIWCIGVPCAAIAAFVFRWPIEWVYAATFVEEFFKMALGIPRFISGKWIHDLTSIQNS